MEFGGSAAVLIGVVRHERLGEGNKTEVLSR
jgi:hypothetical protein